jgi:microcin C transport system substrate-binding protein
LKGSQNLAGIAARSSICWSTRSSPPTAVRAGQRLQALDRVVRAGRYWVPHWNKASHWLAYWDDFDRPATKPRYGRGIPETWWYDRDKALKIERAG